MFWEFICTPLLLQAQNYTTDFVRSLWTKASAVGCDPYRNSWSSFGFNQSHVCGDVFNFEHSHTLPYIRVLLQVFPFPFHLFFTWIFVGCHITVNMEKELTWFILASFITKTCSFKKNVSPFLQPWYLWWYYLWNNSNVQSAMGSWWAEGILLLYYWLILMLHVLSEYNSLHFEVERQKKKDSFEGSCLAWHNGQMLQD